VVRSLILQIVAVISNVHFPILIKIKHNMVEGYAQLLFDLVLNHAKHGRVVVFHVDNLSAVLEREFWIRRIGFAKLAQEIW